jgi:hypothetical protein
MLQHAWALIWKWSFWLWRMKWCVFLSRLDRWDVQSYESYLNHILRHFNRLVATSIWVSGKCLAWMETYPTSTMQIYQSGRFAMFFHRRKTITWDSHVDTEFVIPNTERKLHDDMSPRQSTCFGERYIQICHCHGRFTCFLVTSDKCLRMQDICPWFIRL